ncbi:hypothetical protein CWE11_03205 [Aliidiomarina sanyensis]|uniref:Uncharacterized protein n=1 Tax=Aliidiomarina sanyensis TaxID=1249555 RepID=A0A432WPP7_9GAMM|nr:hypothetical protein CWE11_03205 [Aliidiomarina sanyensis]
MPEQIIALLLFISFALGVSVGYILARLRQRSPRSLLDLLMTNRYLRIYRPNQKRTKTKKMERDSV